MDMDGAALDNAGFATKVRTNAGLATKDWS